MLIENFSIESTLKAIEKLNPQENETVFIAFGEKENVDFDELIATLSAKQIQFLGGIFPGIIYDKKSYEDKAIITKFPSVGKPILVQNLNHETPNVFEQLNSNKEVISNSQTLFILVDGLTSNISFFLSEIYNLFANKLNYFGGGAGSLSLQSKPCIFSNEGMFKDSAIILPITDKVQLGVKHGWEQLEGPVVATISNKNVLSQLNWENAFDIYKQIVESDSGKQITKENFFSIAKGYPFGLSQKDREDVVRDPIMVNDENALICVGEIRQNSVLNILKGKNENLIKAASEAAKISSNNLSGIVKQSFIVDCISRILFLENDFHKELEAIAGNLHSKDPLTGVLTLGEISSFGKGYLEFFNKTTVIGSFYDQ